MHTCTIAGAELQSSIIAMDPESGSPASSAKKAKPRLSAMSMSQVNLLVEGQNKKRWRGWKALGVGLVVVVLAVGVVTAILLAKRASSSRITVPETFSASFTATSRYNSDIVWRGSMHKTTGADGRWVVQGRVWSDGGGKRTTITVLDDRSYVQTFNLSVSESVATASWCYNPRSMLPFGDLNTVFDNAVEVTAGPSARVAAPACGDSTQFALQWGPTTSVGKNSYAYCELGSNHHQLAGTEFVADIYDFTTTPAPLTLTIPANVTSGMPLACPLFDRDASALGGTPTATSRRLYSGSFDLYNPAPPAKARPKAAVVQAYPCVFVSGYGGNSQYWGSIAERPTIKYVHPQFEWDSTADATAFCDAARSGLLVNNVIVFSHGAGSLVVANAFDRGTCNHGSKFFWFPMQSPWDYTPVASAIATSNLCSAFDYELEVLGLCTSSDPSHRLAASLDDGYVSGVRLGRLQAKAKSLSRGQMCGISPMGLGEGGSISLWELNDATMPSLQSDGLVVAQACAYGSSYTFYNTFMEAYYAASVNHLDGSCRYGDAFVDPYESQSPCAWMEESLLRASND